jgi:hypothetical protein
MPPSLPALPPPSPLARTLSCGAAASACTHTRLRSRSGPRLTPAAVADALWCSSAGRRQFCGCLLSPRDRAAERHAAPRGRAAARRWSVAGSVHRRRPPPSRPAAAATPSPSHRPRLPADHPPLPRDQLLRSRQNSPARWAPCTIAMRRGCAATAACGRAQVTGKEGTQGEVTHGALRRLRRLLAAKVHVVVRARLE